MIHREMPSPVYLLLYIADPRQRDPSVLINALGTKFALGNELWELNLLDEAAQRRLHPRVLEYLLAQFYRYKRRQPSTWNLAHDREALVNASRALPNSPQAELLLANVALSPGEEPLFPLRVLLAAAQSRSESWALRVLHSSKDVVARVRSVVFAATTGRRTERTAQDYLGETVQEAIRSDMCALLHELLALNRPVVETAAAKWVGHLDEIIHSAADGQHVSRSASHRLDNAAGRLAREVVAAVKRRELWERIKPIVMERHRFIQPSQDIAKEKNWLGLFGPRHRRRRTVQRDDTAVHAIVTLPDPLFAAILSFATTPRR